MVVGIVGNFHALHALQFGQRVIRSDYFDHPLVLLP